MVRKYLPKSIEEAAEWYMRYVSPVSLIAAFLVDTFFLLRRVDVWTTNLVLFSYLTLAAGTIILISLIQTGRLKQWWLLKATPFLPVVTQYAFGGLFSAYLSLYSRSAAFAASWVFVLALAVLLIANERFVRFYMRFTFQVSIFFTVLFSFLIFYLPLVFKTIGPNMFLASGLISLLGISAFLWLQSFLTPELVRRELTNIARSIAIIFVVINVLYFSGAIPPLPLSLKEAGVYHKVTRVADEYQLLYEPVPWFESYLRYNTVYHRAPGEPLYAFSAVFAPSGLSTTLSHQWQHFNTATEKWDTIATVKFSVVGGRDAGYRGFSTTANQQSGRWRVNVMTSYGQVIGRISFTVVDVPERIPLEQKTL